MKSRITIVSCALVFTALSAQAQIETTGTFTNMASTEISQTALADGHVRILSTYAHTSDATNKDWPLNGVENSCVSAVVAGSDGNPVDMSGFCTGADNEGNSMSWWWRAEEIGSEKCPVACGSWGIYHGTGSMADRRGAGRYNAANRSEDGSGSGTWEGHIMKAGEKMMKRKKKSY